MNAKDLLKVTTAATDPRNADINALIKSAATIGREAREAVEAQRKVQAKLSDNVETARGELGDAQDQASGFETPMFQGLTKVAHSWGLIFNNNPDSDIARLAAKNAADSFAASFTNAADATKIGGGTLNGYVHTITLGSFAETARERLQAVVNRHRDTIKSLKGDVSDNAKAKIAEARRYTVPCGDAPLGNGDWPIDKKTDKPRMPKFAGRPFAQVPVELPSGETKTVTIQAGRGTDRKAQMAAYAELVHAYGDAALDTKVIEAFLDNGGKYKLPDNVSAQNIASRAVTLLEELNLAGGNTSTDAALIGAMLNALRRIGEHGFAGSRASTESNREDAESVLANAAIVAEAKADAEASTETTLVEGAGFAMGGAPEPSTAGKGRGRARKAAAPRAGRMAG